MAALAARAAVYRRPGALLAAVTCTFGNLAAYGQTNMKRLLAYSTIAHAGYMMMPVAAAVALAGQRPGRRPQDGRRRAGRSTSAIYLFMNLGAFAIVAFLRNAIHSEEIADYAGLVRTLARLDRLHGAGDVQPGGTAAAGRVFGQVRHLRRALRRPAAGGAGVGGLNTVLSLFYYLRVVKVMTLSAEPGAAACAGDRHGIARRAVLPDGDGAGGVLRAVVERPAHLGASGG